jgi:hypothetical protein
MHRPVYLRILYSECTWARENHFTAGGDAQIHEQVARLDSMESAA